MMKKTFLQLNTPSRQGSFSWFDIFLQSLEHENEIKRKNNIDTVAIAIPLPSQKFQRTFYRGHFQDPTISKTTTK